MSFFRFVLSIAVLWCISGICSHVYSQSTEGTAAQAAYDVAESSYFYGDFSNALAQAHAALKQVKVLTPPETKLLVKTNSLVAKCMIMLSASDSALLFIQQSENILMAENPLDTALLATTFSLRSHCHDRLSQLEKALTYGQKSLALAKQLIPPHPKIADFYHGLANVYFSVGDHKASYDYYQRAVDVYLLTKPPDDPSVLETRMAKAYTQILNDDVLNANAELDEIISACSDKEENKTTLMAAYSIKAVALSNLKLYEEALVSVNKSLDLIFELFGENNGYAADIILAKGELLYEMNRLDESTALHKKAIDICLQSPEELAMILAGAYGGYGTILNDLGEFQQAQDMYSKALNVLHFEGIESVHEVAYFKELLNVMKSRNKAQLNQYKLNPNQPLSPVHFDEAIQLIDHVRSIFIHEGSKQRLVEGNYSIYEQALDLYFMKLEQESSDDIHEDIFRLFEKGKVQTLLDQLRISTNNSNKLPAQVAETLDSIQQQMNDARQAVFAVRNAPDSLFQIKNKNYLKSKEAYELFIQEIKKDYFDYYQFAFNQDVISLEKLRNSILSPSSALIEYFFGEDDLYAIYISKKEIQFSKTVLTKGFRDQFSIILKKVAVGESLSQSDIELVNELLLNDLFARIPKEIKHLIIVPDGNISYLPFEMLPGIDSEYLIEEFEISYASSATLLDYQQQLKTHAQKSFAGFAPTYIKDATLNVDTSFDSEIAALVRSGKFNLPSAIEEVKSIAGLLNGDVFLNENASEALFKSQAENYNILHLAMHSLVNLSNPVNSRLLFDLTSHDKNDDGQLHIEELYGLHLNASLAVLSACNTGYGNIKKGEGSLSIARAFAYAGVPSTLMSLWEVPDKSTAYIMIEFYKELAKGKAKDTALRQAKITYLNDPQITDNVKSPYYWAGFIATGDMSAIIEGRQVIYYWITFAVLLGLVFTWWWMRGRVKEANSKSK